MPRKGKSKVGGELGGSGTTVYGGVVSDVEYNPTLNTGHGGTGLKIYDRMRKSDPVVKSALKIVKLGILQAEWIVEAGSDDAQGKEQKEFIEEALFKRANRTFHDMLTDVLTYLDFGFYVGEKVFKIEDNKVWLKKLSFRAQTSIKKFETDDGKDGVTQQLHGDKLGKGGKNTPSIPIEKLIIFSNEKEGDNWRGVSILRSAYKPWFMKENYEKIDAIGFERERVGIPVFTMPASPSKKDSKMASELGRNLRANEKAYIKLPNGWEFEIVFGQGNGDNADKAIHRFNRDILSNVLAHFLDLGSGASGSRALSTDQSDAFYRSLQSIAEYVGGTFNEFLVKQLIDLNFDNVKKYPTLKASGIEKIDIELFSNSLQRMIMSGVIMVDDELEEYVRGQLSLPDRPENPEPRENPNDKDEDPQKKKDKEAVKKGDKGKDKEQKKKKFQEPRYWRELTFAEENVNLVSMVKQMDRWEADVKDNLIKALTPEIQSLVDDARRAVQSNDIKRVEDIFSRFKADIMQSLLSSFRGSFESGKLSAANELGVAAPRVSTDTINLLTTKANAIANKITNDLLSRAKLDTISHIEQGTPVDEATRSVRVGLEDQLTMSIGRTASAVAVGGINLGRYSVFEAFPEQIYGLQRSEILDARVCNFCLSLDGRVVRRGDDIARHGQFHFNCRGIWVAILETEEEKPEIGGVPMDLRKRIGTLGEFDQIANPRPLKDSLAEDFVEGE